MSEERQDELIQICFRVPMPLYREAVELAQLEGWRLSELFRLFWVAGFATHAEGSNKRLVNKGLREKQEKNR